MNSMKKILVPLDGSETAESILPQVRRLLKRKDAETILLQAVPGFPDETAVYIRRKTSQLINEGLPARGLVRTGPPAETILEIAAEERVSLVAMSTHGRTGLSRFVFGSVAEKVLRASLHPVLLVRSFPPGMGEAVSRGPLEALPFRRILVPLDGSPFSLDVLPALKEFAQHLDVTVVLLSVTDEYSERWHSPGRTLETAEKDLLEACIPAVLELRKGDAASEILHAADQLSVDLIAMATHGRSGPSRWVMGSVTEKVLRAATVPMLIARQHAVASHLVLGRTVRAGEAEA